MSEQTPRNRHNTLKRAAKSTLAAALGFFAIGNFGAAQARKYPNMANEPKITQVFHHRAEGKANAETEFKGEVNRFIEKQAGSLSNGFSELSADVSLKGKAKVTSSHPTTEGLYGTMISQNETTVESIDGKYTYTFAVGWPEVLAAGNKSSGEISQLFMQATSSDGSSGQVTSILNFERSPKTRDWAVSMQRTIQGVAGTTDQSLMADYHPGHNPDAALLAPDMAQALVQLGRQMYGDAAAGRAPQDYFQGVFGG